MTDSHNYSFFGKESAIILQSSSKKEPYIFLRCIKKKDNGSWEKWSKREGKVIKFSIEEIIMILRVLRGTQKSWSTYHRFNDTQTQISFNLQTPEQLFVSIDSYRKMLSVAQIEVLRMLLEHILKETYLVLQANAKIQFILMDEILKKARQKGVMVCLLKGLAITREFYPDIALRPMSDIDFLIPKSSRIVIGETLKEMGAVFESDQGGHDRYVFPQAYDTVVEVHFHLFNTKNILQRIFFPSETFNNIPWEKMVEMEDGGLRLPLQLEYDYLQLHALKDGYKSLKWLVDTALMDSRKQEANNNITCRFLTNAKLMMHDITSTLIGEKNNIAQASLLWRKSVRDGAIGKARRWERLLMAIACTMNSPH